MVKAGQEIIGCTIVIQRASLFIVPGFSAFGQQTNRCPGRDGEGDQQRKDHGRRRTDRDRSHVGSHQPTDKSHRQNRRDHRPGCQNGGIADFGHRLDGNRQHRFVAASGQAHVADDIFYHHNGVINQDADGKDQRKQGDSIQGVAIEIKNQQRQGQGRGDRQQDHQCFAKTEKEEDQKCDTKNRDAHM